MKNARVLMCCESLEDSGRIKAIEPEAAYGLSANLTVRTCGEAKAKAVGRVAGLGSVPER